MLDVLIAVEGLDGVVLAQTAECVDEVGAEVGVDVLGGELSLTLPENEALLKIHLKIIRKGLKIWRICLLTLLK